MIRDVVICCMVLLNLAGGMVCAQPHVLDSPRQIVQIHPAEPALIPLDSALFTESFDGQQFPPAGWTVINRDNGPLSAWFHGTPSSAFPPYDGTGFAADNFQRANASYIDDYLITPVIPGVGSVGSLDSLVFRARSVLYAPPLTNVPDSLMLLISTSGTDTSAFVYILDYISVPKGQWERFAYPLSGFIPPNSAITIAFRYLHFDGGTTGTTSDFVGIDRVEVTRHTVTGVRQQSIAGFELRQSYPNPFNASTMIEYTVGGVRGLGSKNPIKNSEFLIHNSPEGQVSTVRLSVYDILGREVAVLVNGPQAPGTYSVRFDGSGHASGIYMCRMTIGDVVQTEKLVLLR